MNGKTLILLCVISWASNVLGAHKIHKAVKSHENSKPKNHLKQHEPSKKVDARKMQSRKKKSSLVWGNRHPSTKKNVIKPIVKVIKKKKPMPPQTFCDLSIRVFPLLFYGLSANVEFRVLFRSTCFDFPLLKYFMLKYDNASDLSISSHPSFVQLILFGRVFNLKFLEAFERGYYPDVNVAYKYVRMNPSKLVMNVNTFEENNMLLNPGDVMKQFTANEVARLFTIENPFFCELDKNDTIMSCPVV